MADQMSVRRAIAVVLVSGIVAVACGSGGSTARASVTLQLFGDAEEIAAFTELIEAFEAVTPDIDMQLIPVPDRKDHEAKLATSFSAGRPPDLFLINFRRYGQFAAKDVLEPLGARLQASTEIREGDFYEQAIDAFRFEGRLTCLPQNISSLVVYYNRALFERFDVPEPSADWDWDDFLATARALTVDEDGDGESDIYGLGTDAKLIRLAPFVWQAGGEVVDDVVSPTRTTLLGAPAIRAMRYFIELRRVHKVAPSLEESESEDVEARFQRGGLGMLLDSRRATPGMRAVPDLDWDVAPLPRDGEQATMLHSDAYCMAASSDVKEEAFRFVEFALGERGAPIIARSGRTVPSMRSVAESEAFLDPNQAPSRAREAFLDTIPFIRRVPNIATWNEIETKADVRVEEWFFGSEPPQALGIEIDLDTRELFAKPTIP